MHILSYAYSNSIPLDNNIDIILEGRCAYRIQRSFTKTTCEEKEMPQRPSQSSEDTQTHIVDVTKTDVLKAGNPIGFNQWNPHVSTDFNSPFAEFATTFRVKTWIFRKSMQKMRSSRLIRTSWPRH